MELRTTLKRTALSAVAVGALAVSAVSGAHAATTDLSAGPFGISVDKFTNNAFTDTYDFTFGAPSSGTISSSAIEVKLGKYVDIAWDATKAFAVYNGLGGSGTLLKSFADPGTTTGSFFVEDLPVGTNTFSIVLKGMATGTGTSVFQPGLKGHYDLNVIAQPIPEPATLSLMLAGLFGVGGLARRGARRSSDDPSAPGCASVDTLTDEAEASTDLQVA